ncbi:trypsin-like serine protease [Amycolatopsis sp. NPDC051758]|uniref:trypsin-like serine protease n=1 Tax=Amycolatopsis sp. NPDC051758 TaxID=3363935 RepID=UPI0037B3E8E7
MLLAGPRLVYQQALAALDTPPHTAEVPIDAPWVAAIHYDGGDRRGYFAGVGVAIAPDWVLTCAHLFCPAYDLPETGEPPTAEKTFHVLLGDPRLGTGTRHEILDRVENNYRPMFAGPVPRADRRKPYADLALLRLAEPTDVAPTRLLAGPIPDGTAVSCLGWPDGHRGPGMLTQVDTYTIRRQAGLGGGIRPDEFCVANAAEPGDLGNGYSGAPAVILPEPGTQTQPLVRGLLSRGAAIGDHTIPSPALVVDLNAHRDFIETTAGITFVTTEDYADR